MSRRRVVIENLSPELDEGSFAIKRTVGELVTVEADIFADGHDIVAALLLYKFEHDPGWQETGMRHLGNDRWTGRFRVMRPGRYLYTVQAWIDHFGTYRADTRKKLEAGMDLRVEFPMSLPYLERTRELALRSGGGSADALVLESWIRTISDESVPQDEAVRIILSPELEEIASRHPLKDNYTLYRRELPVRVDRKKALFSAWYELFPRSIQTGGYRADAAEPTKTGPGKPAPAGASGSTDRDRDAGTELPRHGTFADLEQILPDIAWLGFDVLYLPPIHPIGKTARKGRNNSLEVTPGDPGSPWAVGSAEGGHTAVHPELGTLEDFTRLVRKAGEHGIETALDIAFQCSPDHPWVTEHPDWFRRRPDGTVRHAENPPKKYEDIVPLDFETDDWKALWEALRDVFLFWIERGVKIFRVDNPHTKPFPFWEWVIAEVQRDYPEVIFLSEAFTRPKVMYRLAKLGFTQSYTYFTWRTAKRELEEYLTELTRGIPREFFRPNFWPNTPDIMPEHLQFGGRPAFIARLALAATLSPSYGIYGPAYELCVNAALEGKEEYLHSEKYEIKRWDREEPGNIREFVRAVNRIRAENPALQQFPNLRFYEIDNENLLFYERATEDLSNIVLVAVNLDPFRTQSGTVKIPLERLGLGGDRPFFVRELLSDEKYLWNGGRAFIELVPDLSPVKVYRLYRYVRRENDFDYYM